MPISPGGTAVDRHEHHGVRLAAQCLRARDQICPPRPIFEDSLATDANDAPADVGAHACTGGRDKVRRRVECDSAIARAGDDRRGERMFAGTFDARRQPQHFGFVEAGNAPR